MFTIEGESCSIEGEIRLPRFSRATVLAFGLLLTAVAADSFAAVDPPSISKPKPAPATAPNLPPLPPAVFDPKLDIGGNDLKAREIDTRLSVDVRVNGRGPFHFIVDSGADTAAVGLRIAPDLELPVGTGGALGGAGLLGIDPPAPQRLMMDFDKHLIKLEDAAKPMKYAPGDIVIVAR